MGGPGVVERWTGAIVTPLSRPFVAPDILAVTLERISDGTSATALFSERLVGVPNPPGFTADSALARLGFFDPGIAAPADTLNPARAMQFLEACRAMPGDLIAANSACMGFAWIAGFPVHINNQYNHYALPNERACHNRSEETFQVWAVSFGVAPPSSNHQGGVNVAFADGSVRFVTERVVLAVWWALGTRAGGEVISSDAY
jgi:prepilin-type processing-associated H-X9-DG protein